MKSPERIAARTRELFAESHRNGAVNTDHIFAALLLLQWLVGILAAWIISPRAWSGLQSAPNPHVWVAIILGGAIVALPLVLVWRRPGSTLTRYVIAAAQMLDSALLIHLSGGRIETHFHVFGSLAVLAFYRDYRVLMTATGVIAVDHMLRGIFWPQSVFGIAANANWRWVEHACWVLFEDTFLVLSIRKSLQEMRTVAARRAELEFTAEVVEATVNVRTAELAASEARTRTIVDSALDAVVAMDNDSTITGWNPMAETIFGWRRDEVTGRRLWDVIVPVAMRDMHERCLQRDKATENGSVIGQRVEVPAIRRDGSEFPAELSVTRVGTDGSFSFSAFIRDITERKMLESEQRRAKEAAENAARAKSDFLANMSHEIRTPMNAVVGMTGLMLDTKLDAEQRDFVETIRSSGDALLTIINDILDFSKIDSGRMDLEAQPFDVRVCVEEALDLLAAKGGDKGLEMAYTIANDVPARIVGDVTRTRQILVNLLGNAIKFTHAGEVIVSLETTPDAEVEGKHLLHFAVRDTGIGIPADRLDRLFQSFQQVDASTTRKYGGTGLGLAISKRLSEMMGGTMWIESQVGLGSTFHFTATTVAGPPPEPPLPTPPPEALRGKRLLVVDDNATNRRILRLQAETWGMEVRTAPGGPLALEWLRAGETFDLAVLDMQMPDMDGLEVATSIRRLHDARALPLVLLTSMGKAFLKDRGTEAEAFSAFLSKPVKPSQLHAVLLRVVTGQDVNVAAREGSPRLDTGLAERSPLRILLAEDNVVNQKVAVRILERLGYRADVVASGVEAVAAVRARDYDVVLMDVMMPEMDGLQATRQICTDLPPQRRPRIVAMTANAMQGDREACLAAGMDDYISKPVRPEELQAALERSAASRTQSTATQQPSKPPTLEET